MAVDTEGSSNSEVGVCLHSHNREIIWINMILDISPSDSGLYFDSLSFWIKIKYAIHRAHIDLCSSLYGSLSSHTISPTTYGYLSWIFSQKLLDILDTVWDIYGIDCNRI
jgi:hypothetical protein